MKEKGIETMNTKRISVFLLTIIIIAVLLSSCTKPDLALFANEDNTFTVQAVKAPKGYFGASGSIDINESGTLVIDSGLDRKGEIRLRFSSFDFGIDADMQDLINVDSEENTAFEVTVKGPGITEHPIDAGSYMVSAKVLSRANGTIQISVH